MLTTPVPLVVVTCMATRTTPHPRAGLEPRGLGAEITVVVWILAILAIACLALRLHVLAERFDRRAASPLPAPGADPLAHYRDGGPLECPQHPFAH